MVEKILENSKVTLGSVMWFLCIVVVPLTIWFAAISYKIDGAEAKIVIVEKNEQALRENIEQLDLRMTDKLEAIHKDVGEIKGELKRLR